MKHNPKAISIEQMMSKANSGDLIAFSGIAFHSKIIKYITHSNVSHVGLVVESQTVDSSKNPTSQQKMLFEALYSGASLSPLECRLTESLNNTEIQSVWWLRLKKALNSNQVDVLNTFVNENNHKKYDYLQATRSAFDKSFPHPLTYAPENLDQLFCSELVIAAYKSIGLFKMINASEFTPIDVCELNIYKKLYYQLKGKEEKIKRNLHNRRYF